MDGPRFDVLTCRLSAIGTRRAALRLLAAGPLGIALGLQAPGRGAGVAAVDFEGCSRRYWKKPEHLDSWLPTGYSPQQTLESVFDVPDAFGLDNDTLLEALSYRVRRGPQRAARKLLRAAVAALLNAAHPDVDYPLTVTTVIQQVNAVLASNDRQTMLNLTEQLSKENTRGCPLS